MSKKWRIKGKLNHGICKKIKLKNLRNIKKHETKTYKKCGSLVQFEVKNL